MKLSEIREAVKWLRDCEWQGEPVLSALMVAGEALPALLQVIDHYQHTDDSKDFNAALRDAGIEVDS